jgi:hypothetical protein
MALRLSTACGVELVHIHRHQADVSCSTVMQQPHRLNTSSRCFMQYHMHIHTNAWVQTLLHECMSMALRLSSACGVELVHIHRHTTCISTLGLEPRRHIILYLNADWITNRSTGDRAAGHWSSFFLRNQVQAVPPAVSRHVHERVRRKKILQI